MPMKVRDAIRRLKREGWKEIRQSGSHKLFKRDGETIVIPCHTGDLKPGLEREIRKKAGWL